MLEDVFAECVEKLEAGGRIAVNVANLGRKPYRSLSADVIGILQDRLGLLLRGEVIWRKARGAGANCAWGSFKKPGQPRAARPHRAGRDRQQGPLRPGAHRPRSGCKEGLPSVATTTADEFMDATLDVWELAPESATRVGHPAPFPVELPAAADRPLHLRGRRRARPVHGLGHHRGRGGARRAALPRLRHRRGLREGRPGAGRRRGRPRAGQPRARRGPTRRATAAGEALAEAGFTLADPKATKRRRFAGGVSVDWIATDAAGDEWLVLVAGASTVVRTGLRRSDVLFRTLGEAAVLTTAGHRVLVLTTDLPARGSAALAAVGAGPWRHARRRARARRHRGRPPPGGLRGRRAARTRRRAPPRARDGARGRRCRRRRPRSPRSSPASAIAGVADLERGARGARRSPTCADEVWERLRAAPRGGRAPPGVRRGVGQRPGVPRRRAGPARPSAGAGRVEGPHPGARRRGGARRPPRRPRVADLLQVPLEGAGQRRAGAGSSSAAWPAARPAGRGRLVRGGRARRLPGAVRPRPQGARHPGVAAAARRRPHAQPTAPSCAPTSTRAGRPTRRPPTARSPSRSARRRPTAGAASLAKRSEAEAVLWRLLRIGSAPYFVLGAQRDRSLRLRVMTPVGLAPGLRAQAHGRVGRRRRPAPGPLAGPRPRPGHRRGAHRRRPRRGPLEPRPLRQAPRGQGLPRHPPPPRPRLRHAGV